MNIWISKQKQTMKVKRSKLQGVASTRKRAKKACKIVRLTPQAEEQSCEKCNVILRKGKN